ncbi:MAG: pyridoxal phosphate-dependent aminotransferase, partial [Saprospiraceae bacterium]|nr:pyridoxal phosphate-dependent aminotransferase [Saprospiraceae bacterium]
MNSIQLSSRVNRMQESATLKMAQLSRDLTAQGNHVINLSIGEPDFDTPVHIKEAAKKALDEGYTKYTPVPGLPELRQAIVDKFKQDNGLEYSLNQIVVSNGAKQSIANLVLALVNEGDEVILFTPYWVSYKEIVKLGGGVPVALKAEITSDFKVSAEQLQQAINQKTKMIIFSSPCNPTGSVYTRSELEQLSEVIATHPNIIVVSDEIYEYINFTDDHVSIGTFPALKDRTVTVNGFSKGFAMTGWRLGYIGAPVWIAKACTKIQGQFTSGASSFGQKAAAYALQASMDATDTMRTAFLHRRNMMIEILREIDGLQVNVPQGAFYIFPNVSHFFGKSYGDHKVDNADDLALYIL